MYLVKIILILIFIREAVTPMAEHDTRSIREPALQMDNIRASLSLSYTHIHSYVSVPQLLLLHQILSLTYTFYI